MCVCNIYISTTNSLPQSRLFKYLGAMEMSAPTNKKEHTTSTPTLPVRSAHETKSFLGPHLVGCIDSEHVDISISVPI